VVCPGHIEWFDEWVVIYEAGWFDADVASRVAYVSDRAEFADYEVEAVSDFVACFLFGA
jgi:hypothetical protein